MNEPSFIKPCHLSDFPWFLTVKKNAKYFEIKPDVQTFITEFTHYTGTINQQGHSNMISSFIPRLTQQKFRFHYKPWIQGVLNSRMPAWNHRSPVFWISDRKPFFWLRIWLRRPKKCSSCDIFLPTKHLYRINPVMYKPWVYIESAAVFNASIDQTARLRQERSACRTYLHLIILSLSALYRKKCGFPALIPW